VCAVTRHTVYRRIVSPHVLHRDGRLHHGASRPGTTNTVKRSKVEKDRTFFRCTFQYKFYVSIQLAKTEERVVTAKSDTRRCDGACWPKNWLRPLVLYRLSARSLSCLLLCLFFVRLSVHLRSTVTQLYFLFFVRTFFC
jgi:hypothetical protein